MPKETRGGDRMASKFADKKDSVRNFIEQLRHSCFFIVFDGYKGDLS